MATTDRDAVARQLRRSLLALAVVILVGAIGYLLLGFSPLDALYQTVTTVTTIGFRADVFGSDEYNEYVGASFNDVFGFFLDGVNIALIPGSTTPVSINNVNQSQNAQLFKNNSPNDLSVPTPFGIEADGFTVVLTATADISPGQHHIKLAIADAGDTAVDSWVFLADQSFVSGEVDLQITGSDSPDPVIVGNQLTYSYVVTNHGPDPASNVQVQDVLPAGATFLNASVSQGTTALEGGVVSAEIGDLASGASATVTIVVSANQLGLLTNTATVEAAQNETAPENNTITLTTLVDPARLSIDDLQIVEGNSGTKDAVFTVSLNGAENNFAITVAYATSDISTSGGLDYLPRAGVLTFAPGQLSRTINVPIVGDKSNEVTETFQVQLSAPPRTPKSSRARASPRSSTTTCCQASMWMTCK